MCWLILLWNGVRVRLLLLQVSLACTPASESVDAGPIYTSSAPLHASRIRDEWNPTIDRAQVIHLHIAHYTAEGLLTT